jgi:hypothetical protein
MMEVLNSLLMSVVNPLISNPAMQAAAIGLALKWITDQVKKLFAKVDETGVPQGYKVPVQFIVAILGAVASMGTLALEGKLSTFPVETAANFLTTYVPIVLAALGVQKVGNIILKKE